MLDNNVSQLRHLITACCHRGDTETVLNEDKTRNDEEKVETDGLENKLSPKAVT